MEWTEKTKLMRKKGARWRNLHLRWEKGRHFLMRWLIWETYFLISRIIIISVLCTVAVVTTISTTSGKHYEPWCSIIKQHMEFKHSEACQQNNWLQLLTRSFPLLLKHLLWQMLILQYFNAFHIKLLVCGLIMELQLAIICYQADQKVTYKYLCGLYDL